MTDISELILGAASWWTNEMYCLYLSIFS